MLGMIYDSESKNIRGLFVNLVLTFTVLFLHVYAIFDRDPSEPKGNSNRIDSILYNFIWYMGRQECCGI